MAVLPANPWTGAVRVFKLSPAPIRVKSENREREVWLPPHLPG
jgi:hypothetical protein